MNDPSREAPADLAAADAGAAEHTAGVPAGDLALPSSLHRPRAIAAALAVAECLFASESGPPPNSRLLWLGRELDDFLERIGADARTSYLAGVFILSLLAPLLSGSLTPLRKMSLERRAAALDRVESSFASGLLLAVKAMLCIIYYEHPEAAASIGFDGQCMVARAPDHAGIPTPNLISAEALHRAHD